MHRALNCKAKRGGLSLLFGRQRDRLLGGEFRLRASLEGLGLIGLLPGKGVAGTAEVTMRSRLLEDGAAQIEALDDALGRELEVLAHKFDEP